MTEDMIEVIDIEQPMDQMIAQPTDPTPSQTTATEDQPKAGPSSTSDVTLKEEPKEDSETLYKKYLKAFKDRMICLNASEALTDSESKKLEEVFAKLMSKNKTFITSGQFRKLMQLYAEEVEKTTDTNRLTRQHTDLILELRRLTMSPNKQKNKVVKNRKRKIELLTKSLKKISREITKAENEELDLESLERQSSYTFLDKLYRKAAKIWQEREELLKRSTNTGRMMFKKYNCQLTTYPDINRCVEDLFNAHLKKLKTKTRGYIDESFTFIDVRKAILDEIQTKQLAITNTETMIIQIYEELIKEIKSRRQEDTEEQFETYEELDDLRPDVFVKDSPELELTFAKNKCHFEKKLDEIFDKYASEDHKRNGENILNGGQSEWESALKEDNEEFESLDVREGELDEEVDKSTDESDEDLKPTDVPEIYTSTPVQNKTNVTSTPIQTHPKPTSTFIPSHSNSTPIAMPCPQSSQSSQPITQSSQSSQAFQSIQASQSTLASQSSTIASLIPSSALSPPITPANTPLTTPSNTPPSVPTPSQTSRLGSVDSDDEVIEVSDSEDEDNTDTNPMANTSHSVPSFMANTDNGTHQKSIEVIDISLDLDSEPMDTLYTIDKNPMDMNGGNLKKGNDSSVEIIEID